MRVIVPLSSTSIGIPPFSEIVGPAQEVLSSHSRRKTRPPAGVWNQAVFGAITSIESALKSLEVVQTQSELSEDIGSEYPRLLASLRDMYLTFSTFEESCENIALSMISADNPRKSIAFRAFGTRKSRFSSALGRAANSIKHNDGQLRPLLATGNFRRKFVVVPCFYIEGYQPAQDALGPDPNVHAGGNSAFSVLRQIRYYFVHIYFLSAWLQELTISLGYVHSALKKVEKEPQLPQFDYVTRALANGPRVVMPNEFGKNQPDVRFEAGEKGKLLAVTFTQSSDFLPLERGKITSSFRADGYTRTFMLPYMGSNVSSTWKNNKKVED